MKHGRFTLRPGPDRGYRPHSGSRYRHRAVRERAAIFFVSALLVVAVAGLLGRAVISAADTSEPYPELFAGATPAPAPSPEKTVYLTFDDGPSKNTELILDVLAERGAKATFFVTGQGDDPEQNKAILRRIVREGHTIGLHSYSHSFGSIYKSADSYLADLDRLNTFILDATGYRPTIVRFPGGSRTVNASKSVMKDIIDEMERRGYAFYDWHVVSGDDTTTVYPPETLARTILKGIKGLDSAVVLCHDNPTPKTTAEAVAIVMDELMDQGYAFDRLTPAVEPVHIK